MSLADDLNGLFDDVRPPFVSEYFPYEREITAVYEGRKAMAMYDIGRSLIAESDGLYQGVMSIARSLDLEVITDSSAHDSSVTVFVVRAGEQWRAKAYSLMWSAIAKASSPNSDVIEILSSMLLGYADEQIRTWIDYSRWARLGWCGETVYLWMSMEQAQKIRMAGGKYVPRECLVTNEIMAFWRRDYRPLKRNVMDLVPMNFVVGRVALHRAAFAAWFAGVEDSPVRMRRLGMRCVDTFNKAIVSRLEFVSDGQWVGEDYSETVNRSDWSDLG